MFTDSRYIDEEDADLAEFEATEKALAEEEAAVERAKVEEIAEALTTEPQMEERVRPL